MVPEIAPPKETENPALNLALLGDQNLARNSDLGASFCLVQLIGDGMAEIVRAIGVTGNKVGSQAKVLSDLHWRRETAGTWKRSVSQEERKAQRIGLMHTWLLRWLRCAIKVLEEESTRDYQSLTNNAVQAGS